MQFLWEGVYRVIDYGITFMAIPAPQGHLGGISFQSMCCK